MIRALPGPARDLALLLARLALGIVLIAHGWQKLMTKGIDATTEGFIENGIPAAPVSAVFVMSVELLGGLLILAGAATAVVGVLVALVMLGAVLFVHVGSGVFVSNGGWELAGLVGATALALAAAGSGRLSVDHLVSRRRRPAMAAAD
ncbi:DoxX family protein [Pseudonocardia sp. CA-142604]|uniref:DoxX family protein n=1 Tax=Pseudonocardia sp. CA-142604 TaxID=3240024 RepID=UPI003D8B2B8E